MVYMEYGSRIWSMAACLNIKPKSKLLKKTSFMSKQFLQQDINKALYCISIQL